jgi:hypothetical protein
LEKWVTSSPAILSEPGVAETLGMPELAAAQALAVEEAPEPPEEQPRALPATQGDEPEPEAVPDGLTAAAEVLVKQALSRVGGKLLTRETRGQFSHVPKEELYRHIRPSGPVHPEIQFAAGVAETFGMQPDELAYRLERYVGLLVASGEPYDRFTLGLALR